MSHPHRSARFSTGSSRRSAFVVSLPYDGAWVSEGIALTSCGDSFPLALSPCGRPFQDGKPPWLATSSFSTHIGMLSYNRWAELRHQRRERVKVGGKPALGFERSCSSNGNIPEPWSEEVGSPLGGVQVNHLSNSRWSGKPPSIDGFRAFQGADIDHQIDKRIEIGDGTAIVHSGTLDAEFFGLTVGVPHRRCR